MTNPVRTHSAETGAAGERPLASAIPPVKFGHLPADDLNAADRATFVEAPEGVFALWQLGIDPSNDVSARRSAAPDQGMSAMAPRHIHRCQVDFTSKALLVRVQHQGSDITPYVQDEGIGWTGPRT
jgi:hypothetical protein